MSIREIAEICDTRFHRRPSHHSIKTVLALARRHLSRCAASLSLMTPLIRLNVVTTLCSFMLSGWSVASIAAYLGVSKQTVYTTLKRWWQEGDKGLGDKSHARKAPRKVTLEVGNRDPQKARESAHRRMAHACRVTPGGNKAVSTHMRAHHGKKSCHLWMG